MSGFSWLRTKKAKSLDPPKTVVERAVPVIDAQWADRLEEVGFADGDLVGTSRYDPYRRVYRFDGRLWKIALTDLQLTAALRRLDPTGEYELMKRLKGVRGVPSVGRAIATDRLFAFEMSELPGTRLDQLELTWPRALAILSNLLGLVVRLAARGVAHNGLVAENVIVSGYSRAGLVDFDQAEAGRTAEVLVTQLLRRGSDRMRTRGTLWTIARSTVLLLTPRRLSSRIKAIRRRYRWKPPPTGVSESPTRQVTHLQEAWRIAASSQATGVKGHLPVAYYSLEVDGVEFPGERSWQKRWRYLADATSFEGRRILELGCNQGLLSTWAMLEGGAAAALGVDVDPEIISSAALVAKAFDVSPEFRVVDLDSLGDWEQDLLAFDADVIFALNVLRWVKDKKRLLRFLGQFSELVFEGHDDTAIEIEQLLEEGFTEVRLIAISERRRAVLAFRR